MAAWKKVLLGLAAGGIVVLLVAILLIKMFVTPEKVRDLLQENLEASLKRKVDLGKVEVGFFKGIQLERLKIDSINGTDTLLLAQNIELSYDFSALFRGELLFSRILIKEPQLRLVRESDGQLNIADLFGGAPGPATSVDSGAVTSSSEPAIEIPLLVKKFSLQGGRLLFIDRKLNPQSPYLYRLENLDLEIENFSLTEPFVATLATQINDSPLAAELRFGLDSGLQKIELHADRLDLVPFLPYLQGGLPGSLRQGLLSTEILLEKEQSGLAIKGQIVLDDVDFSLNSDSQMHWKKLRIAADQDLFYRYTDQVVEVKNLQVDINSSQIGYRGKLSLVEPLQIAGDASLKLSDLRKVSDLLPAEIQTQIATYGITGNLEIALQLEGQPVGVEVVRQATLKLSDLQASFGALRPAVNGTLDYAAERLIGKQLKVDINGQQVAIDLDATKLLQPVPHLQLVFSGQSLDLDALLPQKAEQPQPAPEVKTQSSASVKAQPVKKDEPVPFVLPVSAQADLQFERMLYKGLPFEDVKGQILLDDGKLTIENLTAVIAGGVSNINAEVELTKALMPYRGHIDMRGINLATITDVLLPEGKGSTTGLLIADGQVSGLAGGSDILGGLNAFGEFDLTDGKIKGSPLLAGLARFLTNPQLEVLGFSRLHGNYSLKKKQGTIDARLESRQVVLAPKGSFSLGGPLNLSLETRISPELMSRAGVGGKGADLLKDDSGWSLFPLKVKGTYSHPRFTLDSSGVKKQIKEGVTRELGRQLQKQLGNEADDAGSQQLQKLLDGTLKKLFGN